MAGKRRRSRELAVQTIFSIGLSDLKDECIFEDPLFCNYPVGCREYAMLIVRTVKDNLEVIDELISRYLVNWEIHRMPKVDLAILRIAVAEFKWLDIPQPVVINEAVDLVKKFSGDESKAFINGILDNICKDSAGGK